jgi:hypothetical protein
MAKRAKNPEPSESERDREVGIVKVEEPKVAVEAKPEPPPAPPIVPPEAPPQTAPGPSFGERVGGFFRFLLRLAALLVILAIISMALYFVLPWLYQKYITPVEQNTAQMSELQSRLEQTEQELADLQSRLEDMEGNQSQNSQSLTELDQRISDIETEINARTESLAALEKIQSELQEKSEENSAEFQRQLNLLKAMELLSRARLFMYQSNFGLARQDVQIARDILSEVQADNSESLADDLDAVVLRLDMTLSNLPNFPVAASDDLDIAWQILLSGLPPATPTLIPSPTLVGTLPATPTAVDFISTPTLVATLPPTATP